MCKKKMKKSEIELKRFHQFVFFDKGGGGPIPHFVVQASFSPNN